MHYCYPCGAVSYVLLLSSLAFSCGERKTPVQAADGHGGDATGIGGGDAGTTSTFADSGGTAGDSSGGNAGSHSASDAGVQDAGTTNVSRLLIDDFEDGNGTSAIGGGWWPYTDKDDGGGSTLTVPNATIKPQSHLPITGDGYRSAFSLSVSYALDKGDLTYDPYVGIDLGFGGYTPPFDFSRYTSLSYTYRGGAHRVRLVTSDVKDYDYFGADMPPSADWTTLNLPFASLAQSGWGTAAKFDPSNVAGFGFYMSGATGQSGQLQVDDIILLGKENVRIKDMPLNPPSPPADVVLDSLEISNPLQAKALQYLNRGYSVANWLDQERFSGFTYDEAFVQKLVEAGFRSLRLPIDLDLYVDSMSGTGEALAITVNDDLFTILDAFNAWTKKYAISLTIDYHQYDRSLSLADTDSLTKAVLLWGRVAEHFASEPREDLFFELLNETGLSFGGTTPAQAEWTALAERMLTAIRTHDTVHSVLFGDVQFYDIDELITRAPLADANVIYAFHFYEPHLFTEQGADFAGMPSTHDIPYPYSADRWSEYSTDYGLYFGPTSDILSTAREYYKNGNRSALRNHIADAKRWGIEHNVPVICNEFGAYARTSRAEDRVRYYADIVSIFQELQIPWQTWYTILDTDGNIVPAELRAALGFGD